MDDVFNQTFEQQPTEGGQPQVEQQPEGGKVEAEPSQPQGEQGEAGAPTAPGNDKSVPLAALESERKQRQDWKEKAIRYEEELKAMRNQQNPQAQQPQNEQQTLQQQMLNERFNMSEMLARQQYQAAGDFENMVELFSEATKANPALAMQLQRERHPWEFAYKEGKKIAALKEIGDDPAAWKERVRAEILAEMKAKGAEPVSSNPASAAPANLPQSLAGARSAAPRGAPAFTGPTPISNLFAN